ncbi:MAG: aspartate aminotransferase family protein [Polyangia bacterium]|jgi:glutamate/tyrosine decarboxylase-like PLP-dependent enzyme|nr:aspartate aminotransferase family protein [Polyangia bacterium]
MTMPKKGCSEAEVFERLAGFAKTDFDWKSGKCFAYTFDAGREAEAVAKRAFVEFMSKNALDPTFFPSVLAMENEVVAMAAAHLGGDSSTAGSFTSGGTESILLAVKAAREYFREVRPDITSPEMILPATAHAAFHKAALYFGIKKVITRVDPVSFKADPEAMRRAIGPSTIMLVGSAASYAHGVVDPIPELGRLALDNGLWLHVDGCIGGFLLPFFKELGAKVVDFDLQVPGVTSISMDLHKYAYAPKGASVVLYQTRELRRHQIFACASWTGYTMVNATMQSTKSAGPLAGAYAVMTFLGQGGYRDIARRLYETKQRLVEGVRAIPELRLLGEPDLPLIAFTSDKVNVFHLIDAMNARGWYVQPQLKMDDYPECVHLSVNPSNIPHTEALLKDLAEVAASVTQKPRGLLASTAGRLFGALDPDRLSEGMFQKILSMAGIQEVGVPDKMADINDIMNVLPPRLAERLLVEYVNRLFAPPASAGLPARVSTRVLPRGPAASGGAHAGGARPGGARPGLSMQAAMSGAKDVLHGARRKVEGLLGRRPR